MIIALNVMNLKRGEVFIASQYDVAVREVAILSYSSTDEREVVRVRECIGWCRTDVEYFCLAKSIGKRTPPPPYLKTMFDKKQRWWISPNYVRYNGIWYKHPKILEIHRRQDEAHVFPNTTRNKWWKRVSIDSSHGTPSHFELCLSKSEHKKLTDLQITSL